jgi:hypothetical protein
MTKRGRVSEAEAELAAVVIEGKFGQRPEPPPSLTERQAEIWRETAASEPADFFNTAALRALLEDYCRHREAAEKLSKTIDAFQPEWLKLNDGAKRYHGLLRMRDLETRAATAAARNLRLTNQARYTPQAAATASRNAPRGPRPWEV